MLMGAVDAVKVADADQCGPKIGRNIAEFAKES